MPSAPVIELEDVSLFYRLARHRIPSFKEYAIHLTRGTLSYQKLWALQGVSFSVSPGEKLGIVGRNGAGKSTLLKVISRVLKPTRGRARMRGTLAAILELGTGFDLELTGRENIYLNGLLLGRRRREIDAKFTEIVDFTELGDFIETPIRNYSSGMLIRLGFAIATAWKPEILVLDEVLSVGDAEFQIKSADRLQALHEQGTTLLMVSHNASSIIENCTRCLWLERGAVLGDGTPEEVLHQYHVYVTAESEAESESSGSNTANDQLPKTERAGGLD